MKMNLASLSALIVLSIFLGCKAKQGSQLPSRVGSEPTSEEDKVFYAVGGMFGSKLKELELNETEIKMIIAGVYDSGLKRELKVEMSAYGPKVQEFFRKRLNARSGKEKQKGIEYFQNFLKTPGTRKTKSGLAYKIIEPGTGKNPTKTDVVEVHYTGTLIDGTVFDSSRERNKPVSFPLGRVIKGWTEGLQLIKKGGRVKLVIPSDLAYGDHGAPPKIPGGATLTFDVELLSIKAPTEKKKSGPGKKARSSPKKKKGSRKKK